jgi:hypothetical protein
MDNAMNPEFPFSAIVNGVRVYGGDDEAVAMAMFEKCSDALAIQSGADAVVYMMSAPHLAAADRSRAVIEAHAMLTNGRKFVGALYGVPWEKWNRRDGRSSAS